MERQPHQEPVTNADLLTPTTAKSYKCHRCGNMFAIEQEGGTCDVCGYHCTPECCRVVEASNQGY